MQLLASLAFAAIGFSSAAASSLWVTEAPAYVRPYLIERFAPAQAVAVGPQIYRFPVTGPSSGGAFSLISTAAPSSGDLGVLPHLHQTHYENFFCLKGGFQVWADKDDVGVNEARKLTVGDFGAVPSNTTHTFQLTEPNSEMTGVIQPGGFEDLFFAIATSNYTAPTMSPFNYTAWNASTGAGGDASEISALEAFDVYAQLDFIPRRDFVNGTAPSTSVWHDGPNELANDSSTPYFVAADYGPKYLYKGSAYEIVQPLITPLQGNGSFTMGTLTLSRPLNGSIPASITLANHTAFQVIEGGLTMEMSGETNTLFTGDVAFIPGGTAFAYWSLGVFAKVLYIGAGSETLDQLLLKNATSWEFAVFPTNY
ncbi:RmlC-like cupin [Gymnopus androsaceus JB14]|uniref:RmlC-like cupin n=1 Tax=Gymnopus androsaceus JB14 TaxID=1447944 RepID=A0A6A4H437_9AGAR|nr:RmlC-like cupin [Gymnopus androsaceus JB14]